MLGYRRYYSFGENVHIYRNNPPLLLFEDLVDLDKYFDSAKAKFLTPEFKNIELQKLKEIICSGKVDKPMVPWLQKLNAIPGTCSQFCCMGHYRGDVGNIVFWADQDVCAKMLQYCDVFINMPGTSLFTGHSHGTFRWCINWRVVRPDTYCDFMSKLIEVLQ